MQYDEFNEFEHLVILNISYWISPSELSCAERDHGADQG
jgi:hypothetical protein